MNRNYTIYSINLETVLIKGHREYLTDPDLKLHTIKHHQQTLLLYIGQLQLQNKNYIKIFYLYFKKNNTRNHFNSFLVLRLPINKLEASILSKLS